MLNKFSISQNYSKNKDKDKNTRLKIEESLNNPLKIDKRGILNEEVLEYMLSIGNSKKLFRF